MILIAHGNTVLADEVVLIACDMAQVRIRVVHGGIHLFRSGYRLDAYSDALLLSRHTAH